MTKFLTLIGATAALALTALTAAHAGDATRAENAVYVPGAASRAALFEEVRAKPCCWNRGQAFESSPSTCRKYGGRVVSYEYCQRQYYGQWNNGPNNGQWGNGQWGNGQWGNGQWPQGRWNNNYGGYNPEKPCCFNNGQYFNSTPKTCRKYGGQTVPQDYCAYAYGQGGYGQGGYGQQKPW